MPQEDLLNQPLWINQGEGNQQPPMAAPAPLSRANYDYAVSQNTGFNYTPQQLGWDDATAQRLGAAGISQLPGWFNKDTIYSDAFHLGSHDPIQNYIDLYNTPMDQAAGQWSASSHAAQSLFGSTGVDPSKEGDAGKEAYLRGAFGNLNNAKDSWWDRNKGWAIPGMGFATIASMGALAPVTAGATAGAEAAGGLSAAEASAMLGGSGLGYGAYGASGLIPEAIAAGTAAGADVGMGAGTSWLTDLGLPASYGNDLSALLSYGGDTLAGLDWGALAKDPSLISKLLGGAGLGGAVATGTQPTNIMGGGTTSAPQTSQIAPPTPMGQGSPIAPATMPTSSMMSAFGNRNEKPDYQKYFQTIFQEG